jgi:hypothetical protein
MANWWQKPPFAVLNPKSRTPNIGKMAPAEESCKPE